MRITTIPIVTLLVVTLLVNNICFRVLMVYVEDLLKMDEMIVGTIKMKETWRRVNWELRRAAKEEFKRGIFCCFVPRNIVCENNGVEVIIPVVVVVLLKF